MKKWSIISSLAVFAALAVTAIASVGTASAANYCPTGEEGTPPYCHKPTGGGGGGGGTGGGGGGTTEPPKTCAAGQVGTSPNCVTPTIDVKEIKTTPNSSTISFVVNAPGKVKVSGKGILSTTVSVSAGKVKIKVKLTKDEKEKLKEKGKLTLKVTVTYTPTGGTPVTKTVKITVKSPSKGHHK